MSNLNWLTVYFKNPDNGEVVEYNMYAIDAHDAVRRFPDQYRLKPWGSEKAPTPAHAEEKSKTPDAPRR